jgi:hypothetical protein
MITDIPDIVEKINENLPDQIRMWGNVDLIIEFCNKKFFCEIYLILINRFRQSNSFFSRKNTMRFSHI